MKKKLAIAALGGALVLSGLGINTAFNTAEAKSDHSERKVENVIFMIPDGYSAAYATNYRWYKGESTTMDSMLVGMSRTYSNNSEVTDSAAAGTAMATGTKTNNGMISTAPDGKQLKTIMEAAKEEGKATGLVATATITHATPAVFSSHVAARANEGDIAPQQIENADVLLGGGKQYFLPEAQGGKQKERNLLAEAKEKGFTYVEDRDQLMSAKGDKLIGLFANDAMAPELDREETNQPSLEEMTVKAIDTLEKDKDGFFLMVEGSQIDWAGHAHDAAWAMKDAAAFEKAVQKALDFAKKDGNTLVVVVGDHDTGGMSVGGYGVYDAKTEVLRDVTATGNYMASKLNADKSNLKEVVKTYTSLDLTDAEINKINAEKNTANAINDVISERALVGWTTPQHTGVDVPLYAFGPQSDEFRGLHNNTDIPNIMAEAMNVPFGEENKHQDAADRKH
ncbi:alkaline phosphatase [Paenibacillus xerothermodurans]|uniref:alkaline phosphatase n=1 Tax=Paenibacillus xerothermodurans TaxID=1977292 RepID=UPI001FB3306B|nr:alkaline phosphatase [Paenibacillus xerothermodurans]